MTSFSSGSKRRAGLSGNKPVHAPSSGGFKPIDWTSIDPETPDQALLSRFKNLTAAKHWAKWTQDGPLDDATCWKYVLWMREKRLEGENAASGGPKSPGKANAAFMKTLKTIDERLEGYLPLVKPPILPNDRVSLTQLCSLEARMELLNAELEATALETEDDLLKRKMLSEELKQAYSSYVDFQKNLKITKLQREGDKEQEDFAAMFRQNQEETASWMADELDMPRCACGAELCWLWYAYKRVHDPLPYVFVGSCPCGRLVSLGNEEAAKAARKVLEPIMAKWQEESYVHAEEE